MKLEDTDLAKPLHSRLMAAIYAVSNKIINGGREGKAAKELASEIEKGKFTEQDVYDCIKWAKIEKFDHYAISLLSIQKLMPQFLLMNKAADVLEDSNQAEEIIESYERIKILTDIYKQLANDYGFTQKTAEKNKQSAEGLSKHLDRFNIPNSRLWEIYYEAAAIKDENSFWSPTIFIKAWESLQRKEQNNPKQVHEPCSYCQDKMKIEIANPDTGKSKIIPCPKH